MAAVVRHYLQECAKRRCEPFYGFVENIEENTIDADLDFVGLPTLRILLVALSQSEDSGLSRLRLVRKMRRSVQHPPVHSQRLVSYQALLRQYGDRELDASMTTKLTLALASVLKVSPYLQEFHLVNVPIGIEGGRRLGAGIPFALGLRVLDLSGSGIGDEGAGFLLPSAAGLPHLNELSLSQCGLTDRSSGPLAKLVSANRAKENSERWVESLRATGRNADEPGAVHTGLQVLNLSGNFLGDTTIVAMADRLTNDESLHSLDLSDNVAGGDAARAVLSLVRSNRTLSFVDLSGNAAGVGEAVANAYTDLGGGLVLFGGGRIDGTGCMLVRSPQLVNGLPPTQLRQPQRKPVRKAQAPPSRVDPSVGIEIEGEADSPVVAVPQPETVAQLDPGHLRQPEDRQGVHPHHPAPQSGAPPVGYPQYPPWSGYPSPPTQPPSQQHPQQPNWFPMPYPFPMMPQQAPAMATGQELPPPAGFVGTPVKVWNGSGWELKNLSEILGGRTSLPHTGGHSPNYSPNFSPSYSPQTRLVVKDRSTSPFDPPPVSMSELDASAEPEVDNGTLGGMGVPGDVDGGDPAGEEEDGAGDVLMDGEDFEGEDDGAEVAPAARVAGGATVDPAVQKYFNQVIDVYEASQSAHQAAAEAQLKAQRDQISVLERKIDRISMRPVMPPKRETRVVLVKPEDYPGTHAAEEQLGHTLEALLGHMQGQLGVKPEAVTSAAAGAAAPEKPAPSPAAGGGVKGPSLTDILSGASTNQPIKSDKALNQTVSDRLNALGW